MNELNEIITNFTCLKCGIVSQAANRVWVNFHVRQCGSSKSFKKKMKLISQSKKKVVITKTETIEEYKKRISETPVVKPEEKPEAQLDKIEQIADKKVKKRIRRKVEIDLSRLSKASLIGKIIAYKNHIKGLEKALKASKKNKSKSHSFHEFYDSRVWRELRYKVLKTYGRICMNCRTTAGRMHVDHIKPRSLHPELELEFNNLQVLCEACNIGKSNKDQTDFRQK